MAGLSSAQLKTIDNALKRANTRIARLEDAFGRKSATFKKEIGPFDKGPLHKYVGESASGHWKLNIPKIKNDIKSGKLNYDQANEILVKSSGLKITFNKELEEEEIVPTSYTEGFKTVQGTLLDTLETITKTPEDFEKYRDADGFINVNKAMLKEITEELNVIGESFQTEYNQTLLTASEMKDDPVLSKLYLESDPNAVDSNGEPIKGGTRKKGTSLTYPEMVEITQRLQTLKKEMEAERLSGKKRSKYLSNKSGE